MSCSFLPQIVKGLGLSNLATGFVTAIPYVFGTIGLLAWGYSSDKRNERRWHLIVSTAIAHNRIGRRRFLQLTPSGRVAAMCIATIGIYGSRPSFWPMPSVFLTGGAAAVGMAFINSIGALGGYFGPLVVGWIKDETKQLRDGAVFPRSLRVCVDGHRSACEAVDRRCRDRHDSETENLCVLRFSLGQLSLSKRHSRAVLRAFAARFASPAALPHSSNADAEPSFTVQFSRSAPFAPRTVSVRYLIAPILLCCTAHRPREG